jgi:hypothetical protein
MPNKRIGRRGTAAIPGQKRSPNRPPRSVLIASRCPNFGFPAVLIRLRPPADLKFPWATPVLQKDALIPRAVQTVGQTLACANFERAAPPIYRSVSFRQGQGSRALIPKHLIAETYGSTMGYRRLAHAQTMAPMSQRLRRLVLGSY